MPLLSFGKKRTSPAATTYPQEQSIEEAGTSQGGPSTTHNPAAQLVGKKLSRDRRRAMLALDALLAKGHKLVASAEKHPTEVLSAEKVKNKHEDKHVLTVGKKHFFPISKQKRTQEQSRATVLAALLAHYDSAMKAAGIDNFAPVDLGSDARLAELTDPTLADVPVTGEAFLDIAQAFVEILVKQIYRSLPPSHAKREAPRAPSDCLMHWIAALTAAHAQHPSARIETEINAAKHIWLSHQITRDIVKQLLDSEAVALIQDGTHALLSLATALSESMGNATDPIPLPILHDNIYGRAFESFMSDHLVNAPPASALKAMQTVGKALSEILDKDITLAKYISLHTANAISKDQRFWFPKVPRLKEYSQATTFGRAMMLLRIFLKAPILTGHDCIAMAYLAAKFAVKAYRLSSKSMPYMRPANTNYHKFVKPAKTRLENINLDDDPLALPNAGFSRDGGLSLWHQPSANEKPWMAEGVKPVSIYRPNFEEGELSVEATCQLTNGIPYAAGASGMTNILLHLFNEIEVTSKSGFDKKAAFLATLMFLNYDGGHSFHESLWVANQMTFMTMPAAAQQLNDYQEYIADYGAMSSYFADDTAIAWEQAIEAAWPATVAYFRQHSHFSND